MGVQSLVAVWICCKPDVQRLCDYAIMWPAGHISTSRGVHGRSDPIVSSRLRLSFISHLSSLISHLSSLSSQLSALIPHLCQKPRLYKSCPYSQTGTGSLVPMSSVLRQRQRYILSSLRLAKEMVCTNQCHLSIVPRLLPQGEMHQRRIEFCFLLP